MFKQVTYNTYIGKSKLGIIKDGTIINGTTMIGDIASPFPTPPFARNSPKNRMPDYYLMGIYLNPTEDDPGRFFQITEKPIHTHKLCITGIPKKATSLNPYRLEGCIWSSYYEDDLHGFLFQIVEKSNILKLKEQ